MHHAFLYISLPSLHDYDVKMPNFTMYRGSTQATTKFPLSLSELGYSSWEFNLRRVRLHLTKLVTWSYRDEDWKNANSLFQRRFLCRRRPRILRSLLIYEQWARTSAYKGATGSALIPFLSLLYPSNPWCKWCRCEGWPHHRGLRPLLFSTSSVGSFSKGWFPVSRNFYVRKIYVCK